MAKVLLRFVFFSAFIMFLCYTGCPTPGFPTEKRLRLHQKTCKYAKEGFALALSVSKRKLAADADEAASKLRAQANQDIERQHMREQEAESSFHPFHESSVTEVSTVCVLMITHSLESLLRLNHL
jgi:hypothetical protein